VAADALEGRLTQPYSAAETVAAALVHDVVEDADVNEREDWKGCIGAELGPNVLELAVLLCNPSKALPDGTPRAQKKAADVAHYRDPERPAAVRLVKLCDRSDNLADMRVWRRERALTYIDESVTLRDAILAGLWESAACVNYGKVATQNAFKPAVERYNAAMKGAFDRFGALPPA
jgi:(p)ppGpp synthase/HD superfamily hydrolase